jgi:hypothetical protein
MDHKLILVEAEVTLLEDKAVVVDGKHSLDQLTLVRVAAADILGAAAERERLEYVLLDIR